MLHAIKSNVHPTIPSKINFKVEPLQVAPSSTLQLCRIAAIFAATPFPANKELQKKVQYNDFNLSSTKVASRDANTWTICSDGEGK